MKDLSIGRQQLIEIARALSSHARIVIMDEPTSSLSGPETQKLFELIQISAYWQDLISGFIVLAAVSIDSIRKYRESLQKAKVIKGEEELVS